jgi:uncharacterized protein (DUF58 family)
MRRAWGVLLIWSLALVFAIYAGRDLAFNLLYFLSGLLLASFCWAWFNVHGLAVRRVLRTQRSQVGKYFEENLELVNRSWWPKLWVEVHDLSDLPGHSASRVVSALRSRGVSHWQVRTLCQHRGRFVLGPIVLTSGDPLGIFRFSREVMATRSLVVTPAIVDIPHFVMPSGYLPGGEALRRRTPYVTASVSGVRDYAPGDSFSRIHWPSTARRGRLISKEFELDPLADVWICLDMHQDIQAESPWAPDEVGPLSWVFRKLEDFRLPPSTVEYGVATAASLARHFLRSGREVGFLSLAASREVVQPDRGERQLTRLLEILAVIQARGTIPLEQVLASDGSQLARHTTLVVITSSAETRWVTALRGLRSRGVQGIAVFMIGSSFGSAPDSHNVVADLQASGLPAILLRRDDDLAATLSRATADWDRAVAA